MKAVEKFYLLIAKSKVTQMIKVIIFTFIMGLIISFCGSAYKSPHFLDKIANLLAKSSNRIELDNQEIREQVTPKIHRALKNLNIEVDADRSCVLEFHNGKENMSMMPFRYADMTYEEVNNDRKILRVADKYQDLNLTHYPFASYLAEDKNFAGDMETLLDVDEHFSGKVEECNGEYICASILTSNGQNLGILIVFYEKGSDSVKPAKEKLIKEVEDYSHTIANLLDLGEQKKDYGME